MSRLILLLALAGVMRAAPVSFCSPSVNLVGASTLDGCSLRLTSSGSNFQAGAAWLVSAIDTNTTFAVEFPFQITTSDSVADGFAFMLQGAGPGAIGPSGGALAYFGIPNSLAIEFDIYRNIPPDPDYADPNANHVAIVSCGVAPNNPAHNSGCTLAMEADPGVTLADGLAHLARVTYSARMLSVTVDGRNVVSLPVDLPTSLGLTDGMAYLGFTGSTGGGTATQRILSLDVGSATAEPEAVPEPATWLLVVTSMIGAGFVRSRRRNQS